ncbi:MAG: NAD(P)/FAD-dependent oxidoreductase, partial [Isosphaeraceae bacterium]
IIIENDEVKGVTTSHGNVFAQHVIITAGAWSGPLLQKIGVEMPTRPVKGQMLLLDTGRKTLNHIIEHEKCYLVPRDEGLILAGATEEWVGFDDSLTTDARNLLRHEATSLVPELASAQIVNQWCGFRPGSKDSRPYLGGVCGISGLYVATGHQRAGLSLSPATAESLADLITGQVPHVNLDGYRIDREPAASRNDTTRS